MKNMDVLIDTNVILDVLTHRDPFYKKSKAIFDLCANKILNGYLAAHTITNVYYILRKIPDKERRQILLSLFNVFTVVGIDSQKLISALERNNFPDFEDCLQDECAKEINADYIITRNTDDYLASKVKALTPEQFMKIA